MIPNRIEIVFATSSSAQLHSDATAFIQMLMYTKGRRPTTFQ